MLKDIVEVKLLGAFRLHLRFEDGLEGEVNISHLVPFTGVFQPLADPAHFAKVEINPEVGTICWPCGADLDPDVLYAQISGTPIENMHAESGSLSS
jgi:hypothetical protein